jgi:hypothetical protein
LNPIHSLILVLAAGGLPPGAAGIPGDGGDDDPTTFSFHADNRIGPLLGPQGERLRAEDVALDYGRAYAVFADGVDVCSVEYAWALGYGGDHPRLQPRYQDLSRWERGSVENGWLAIDPLSGRFKFARANSVKDPRRLEHKKEIVLGNLTMWRLEAQGKFAFTVGEEEVHALLAYDASDPANFRYGGYSSAAGYPFAVALGETHAYVSGSGYLSVHDVRDPRHIRYVKTIANGGSEKPFDICADVAGKRLYQMSDRGLQVFDISKGDDPILLDIHEEVRLPYLQAQGEYLYGLRRGEGPQQIFTLLCIYRSAPDGALSLVTEFPVAGLINSLRGAIRHLLVEDGLAFLILSTGLQVVDVKDPRSPRRLKQLIELAPVNEYYEKGSGAHDMASNGRYLFVACGHSRGGWVNPRESGLFRDHADFADRVLAPSAKQDLPQLFRGGLRIYDLRDPSRMELVTLLDDEVIGYDAITNVALGDGILFLGSRLVGVLAYDIADIKKPRLLGRLSNMGEVDWARLVGDKLYAVSNGVYVIDPYPAEEASLKGFSYTDSFMFGRSVVMNPYPAENPDRVLFALSGTTHRQLTVRDPARPLVTNHAPPPVGYGRWKGNHLFAPGVKALDVYRVDLAGQLDRVFHLAVPGPTTHLEIHRDHLFLFGLVRDTNEPVNYLHVFDIRDPERPRLAAVRRAPTDPGWQSSRLAGGGQGWGNFLGVRVVDLREPEDPKMHCLIHHVPADISVNSLNCPESFYASGDTLYIADYWTGIHVLDITELASGKSWRHLGVVKDRGLPWSVNSYATSATGYGRYLYTTHFGEVNIWEIPVGDDVPRGTLTVEKRGGGAVLR